MEPTIEIAAYNTSLEAELVMAKLREAGIDGHVIADNLGGAFPMMQMLTGGYKVMVPETQAMEAKEIAIADDDLPLPEPVSGRSAAFRVLSRLTGGQILLVLGLFAASLIGIIYGITQAPL